MRPVGSKYLLEETLGRGATGTVWRALVREDAAVPGIEPGRPVAIKILREELAADPDVVMRFLRERSVLLRLTHPNVVRVRDLVVEGELLALVMDLVEGPDLYRYLRTNGPFSPVAGALLMAQIADALAASHTDGIVHRDLKPANVLLATVTVDGAEQMHPMLTDFGIARLADSPGTTRTHEFVGTPAYVAPESADGRPQTAAVDVYGAGIMLYELVTGRPPFQGDSPVAILQAHLREEPQRPRTMPEPVWTVIERCLRKNPAERPSAVSLAHALRVVAAGIGVHSSPAAVDAAIEVGALLLPDPLLTAGLEAAAPFGEADPTQVLPSGAGGYSPAAATQVFGAEERTQLMGGGPAGAEDRTQLMGTPAGAPDRTRVMPPMPPAPAGPPQAETPHPWQTQLRAARDRNQQTEIGYLGAEELAAPQVAPRPYQAPRPGQQPPAQPYGRPPQERQPNPGYAQRPPVAPPPYRANQGGQEPQPYGGRQQYQEPQGYQPPQPYQQPPRSGQGYPQAYPPPARPAPAPQPARRAEPESPRRAEPPAPQPREPREREPRREAPPAREPRRRSPNRMYIPGLGCLKGCLMVLLILAVAAVALWNFTPLPHYWDNVHHWYTSVSDWVGRYTG
ncbi:serine/threonine-protein kinase [Kitasatospora sp. GP82]|uniref:serine/threonine-protein kinase n=1 Tax=Kitasatospora sp. GP82 TaxID=3035089 RepID=UPI00247599B3|nr:serine/threonine-protein kinase [Kitasatospora sp. GP82]MDH6126705.1 serine/threonine-protein kinase [Kitasatospora sp. GP82]